MEHRAGSTAYARVCKKKPDAVDGERQLLDNAMGFKVGY